MTTEELLKKHGVIRYGGKLIYCEKGKFFYRGVPYPSLLKAQARIDKLASKYEPRKSGGQIHTEVPQ